MHSEKLDFWWPEQQAAVFALFLDVQIPTTILHCTTNKKKRPSLFIILKFVFNFIVITV